MQQIRFFLTLDRQQCLAHYRGQVQRVRVKADDGRWVDLPAHRLRPFVSKEGLQGYFELKLDEQGRFVDLQALSTGSSSCA